MRSDIFIFLTNRVFSLPVVPSYVLCYEGRMWSPWEEEVVLESPCQREQKVESHPLPAAVKHWEKKGHESRAKRLDIKAVA